MPLSGLKNTDNSIHKGKFQLIDMFPRTTKGQKPVDMFLANRKNVDMFLELKVRTGRIMDMFLTVILRTGTKNDYLFRFLVPCRDGDIAVKGRTVKTSGSPKKKGFCCHSYIG